MTPERWQQIRSVLEEAMELAPEQRSAFLQRNCSADSSLRQEVETLLAATPDARFSFLQSMPLRVTLTSGQKLGDYEVKSLIGSGGMGEVYRARDSRLGRDVAIKVLPLLAAGSDRLWRFEQEARAAAALNHPNILATFQMGTYEGAPYLVSELLEGETLRQQLQRGSMSVRKAIDYGVQIARGLAAAHDRGIVHRDLKPENLFVTKDGRVKILDFGLAKLTQPRSGSDSDPKLTQGTEPGVVMGTVGYMSPEQVRGQTTDHRADIFAFGAILYEMLTGKRAFQKPTSAETMSATLNEDPRRISQTTPNIPPALQRVVNRCLEKSTEQRFQSASDLAFALEALSDTSGSDPIFPRNDAGGSKWITFVREHRLGLAAALALIVLLAGARLYLTQSSRRSEISHAQIRHKQFTFSGDAYDPAISPDGLFVAYVLEKPGEKQKLMVQASSGAELELARGAAISEPRWSPDGSEVLFERHEVDSTAKSFSFFVVSRLGGVVHSIGAGAYACWLAPDGAQIVVAWAGRPAAVRLVNKVSGEVKEVRLSGDASLEDIDCSARAPLILAVIQSSDKFQIRAFKPDGSEERKLVEESEQIYSARWSPVADLVYYLHGKGSTKALSKVSTTGRDVEPEVLADGLQTGEFFTLSRDGSRLAYTREDEHSNLWKVELPTPGKSAKLEIGRVTSGTSFYGAPGFSPDGRWIAFALGPNPDETNIFKMPIAGGEPVQLTFFERATTASPAWSADGERIAFIANRNGPPRVWLISASGGTPQPLEYTNASETTNRLAWFPGSDIVYQQSGLRNLLRIDDKTRREYPVIPDDHQSTHGHVYSKPVFSPDGKKIAVEGGLRSGGWGIWIISLEPYTETFLPIGIFYPAGWSTDERYLYAIRENGIYSGREINRVQVAAPSEVTALALLPGDVAERDGATVSPDGREMIASVSEQKSDVWLMENFDQSSR
jgi:serine/threonine protein kinase